MQRPHRLATRPARLIASAIACACLSLAPSAIARTDPPSPLPAALGQPSAAAPQPTIIHETIAAKDTGDNTVPIALAAGALLVAIGGTGYSITTVTRINRRITALSAELLVATAARASADEPRSAPLIPADRD